MKMMHSMQHKRGRYGEVPGDAKSWPSGEVCLVEFLRPVGLSISIKRCPHSLAGVRYSLLVSFSGNIIILEVPRSEERY